MSNLDHLLQRNKEFAVQQSAEGTLMPSLPRAMPKLKAIIIGCADMRVDPAHVLGTKPGEAVVLRNIGGRITPGLLEQLSLLGRIGEVAGEPPGGGGEFHLIVLQHTIAASLGSRATPPCWRTIFKYRKAKSAQKRSSIPVRRLPWTLPRSERFPHYRALGLFQASCTMLRLGLLRSLSRRGRFVPSELRVRTLYLGANAHAKVGERTSCEHW